jgi:hypothetical protein
MPPDKQQHHWPPPLHHERRHIRAGQSTRSMRFSAVRSSSGRSKADRVRRRARFAALSLGFTCDRRYASRMISGSCNIRPDRSVGLAVRRSALVRAIAILPCAHKNREHNYNPPDWAPATALTGVDERAPLSADKGGTAHQRLLSENVAVSNRDVRWTGPLPVKTNCRNCRQLPSSALRCLCEPDPQRCLVTATHYTLNSINPLAKQQHHSTRVAQQCVTKFSGSTHPMAQRPSRTSLRAGPPEPVPGEGGSAWQSPP